MAKLTFWDKTSDVTFPNGATYTAKQLMESSNYGFTKAERAVVLLSRGITLELSSFAALCGAYKISDELSDDDALDAINTAREAEQTAAENATSSEDRATAALEFIAMSLM